eukprot:TRINITY_DN21434_c0_g1_i1.p1 TRINITY_DN21434_c0_g1~~TRINITY_DN21434_c0_g1_i1.p1  ORF type:complete len:247 (-),score=71.72 TRINITY_DN21434_c0_g1_i1:76-750(-)
MAETSYPLATEEDFDNFVKKADSTDNWTVVVDKEDLKVWEQPSKESPINIIKLWSFLKDVDPVVMYDVLHDPEYRAEWDENMIEGLLIEQLDRHNDIGYYAAKVPSPVSNRDFVNQRSWRVKEGTEWLIFNHSVVHPKMPEKKGFVRAKSILTGYIVRPAQGGCNLIYLTQSDPAGWIPTYVANKVTKTFAPKIIDKLTNACKQYNEWKEKHNPNKKPWRIFDN